MTQPKDREPKKLYQKPMLAFVPLRSEEAVLGFCKNSTGTGPMQGSCKGTIICKTLGS